MHKDCHGIRFIVPEPKKAVWLKPWPQDAVMIVAANAGEELREHMEEAVPQKCRECGRDLMADTHAITAETLPNRCGRPIKFFCIDCCVKHERPTEIHDERGRYKN